MSFYDRVNLYYSQGLWTAEMVANAVVKGKLSDIEYQEITGFVYPATE